MNKKYQRMPYIYVCINILFLIPIMLFTLMSGFLTLYLNVLGFSRDFMLFSWFFIIF